LRVRDLRDRLGDGARAVGDGEGGGLVLCKQLLRINSDDNGADLGHGVSNTTVRKGGGLRAVGREGGDHLSGVNLTVGAVLWSLDDSSGSNTSEDDGSGELHFRRFWLLMYVE